LGSLIRALPLPFFTPISGLDVLAHFLARVDKSGHFKTSNNDFGLALGGGGLGLRLERSSLATLGSEHEAIMTNVQNHVMCMHASHDHAN